MRAIGRKAVACNLSDCAAMAVRPVAATVSLALRRGMTMQQANDLMRGAAAAAKEFDAQIAGGDTTVWDHPLAIDVAIVAEPYAGVQPVQRGGARAGDRILVTGPLGGSLLGRHMTFTPRVREARRLSRRLGARLHAMMDISDGLLLDLHRICAASGVGVCLVEEEVRQAVSAAARRAGDRDGRSALDHALCDGEDFELLIAAAVEDSEVRRLGVPLIPIGWIRKGGFVMRLASGRMRRLKPAGYVHR
ncbi:MAG: Thiamine-monophosphate kinase [Phycisphaerae bacterium]|nr:Thiamine-monophosphate kinase [Phycisphaerae bacterium]